MSRRGAMSANLWAAVLALGCLTPSCPAGYISEVFLADDALRGGMPDTVELAGLDGLSGVELIVIDASPSRFGQVLQVITLPVVEPVQLIGAAAWSEELWQRLGPAPEHPIELNTLGETGGFDFEQARSLLLYDRQTLLSAGRINLLDPLYDILLNGAVLLDSLTFTLSGAPVAPAAGLTLAVEPGDVISRPAALNNQGPGDALLVGQPDDWGFLKLVHPVYRVTPGWLNPPWEAAHQPEPATLSALLLGLGLTLARRRPRNARHPRHRRRPAAHCS